MGQSGESVDNRRWPRAGRPRFLSGRGSARAQRIRHYVTYNRYVEAFSRFQLPLFVKGNGPDLSPREIQIRDPAPIIAHEGDGVELTEVRGMR
jgi:hypothetical protein